MTYIVPCPLKIEVIRRDWHTQLATSTISSAPSTTSSGWDISYTEWRGYIQRQARYKSSERSKKPAIILIHGFGGSITQFSGLAEELSLSFDVHSLDSLGFG